jgi:hypothetical protein
MMHGELWEDRSVIYVVRVEIFCNKELLVKKRKIG